tara:strand:+ start:116 stop:277 length:162 start_codon:yes stop_codon:yes gene_type:complete
MRQNLYENMHSVFDPNHLIKQVALETTVFSFKISFPFEQWTAIYESEENKQLM